MTMKRKLCLGVSRGDAVAECWRLSLTRTPMKFRAWAEARLIRNPEDLDGTAMVGAHVELEQPGSRVISPNLTYWKVDGIRDVAPNVDSYYHSTAKASTTPWRSGRPGWA